MAISALLAGLLVAADPTAARPAYGIASYPFRDPGLPLAARIDDLPGRLTVAEKATCGDPRGCGYAARRSRPAT